MILARLKGDWRKWGAIAPRAGACSGGEFSKPAPGRCVLCRAWCRSRNDSGRKPYRSGASAGQGNRRVARVNWSRWRGPGCATSPAVPLTQVVSTRRTQGTGAENRRARRIADRCGSHGRLAIALWRLSEGWCDTPRGAQLKPALRRTQPTPIMPRRKPIVWSPFEWVNMPVPNTGLLTRPFFF